jgi:predicted ATP-grasp superfamily ATP-dependent carboligase
LKIILYEYASGGGYAGQKLPTGILAEGFGMLRSIAADFKANGHEVTLLLDARLSKLNPPIEADCTVPVMYPEEPRKFLTCLAKINDSIYIIAPETGQILQTLVELAEKTGKTILNCKSKAITKVANKALLYDSLQENGFPIPKTLLLNTQDTWAQIKRALKQQINYPVVFKPIDGVGCSGLSVIEEEVQVRRAIAKIRAESKCSHYIAQEFVKGESASVSLLVTENKALAISLNKQNITMAGPEAFSSYNGGCIPFDHPYMLEAFELAEKVVESFHGLQGYVGVDLVLAQDKVYVVDVNPRLTTSCVGLRKVVNFNLAKAIENAVLEGVLPVNSENRGVACLLKVETPKPSIEAFNNSSYIDAVVSPAFPFEDNVKSCALLIGNGTNLDEATCVIEEAKKRLCNIIG